MLFAAVGVAVVACKFGLKLSARLEAAVAEEEEEGPEALLVGAGLRIGGCGLADPDEGTRTLLLALTPLPLLVAPGFSLLLLGASCPRNRFTMGSAA